MVRRGGVARLKGERSAKHSRCCCTAFFGDGAWFAFALTPVARYQPSLGRALGKWLLSLSTNSRLYWPDSLPSDQQTGNASDSRDPNGTLPYEAARHCLYFRPEHKCLTGAAAGPIGTGDVHELLNGASSLFPHFVQQPCWSWSCCPAFDRPNWLRLCLVLPAFHD